ncbi:MAG: TRAP transporter substrate-binding protein DctP [Hyphomicrobiaceae bacterium]|nr:TRAP transporter substrate-binding protein DctP [Hyphomicrobiaceae bacterium]
MRPAPSVLWLFIAVLCLVGASAVHAQTTPLRLVVPISLDSPTGQNMREFARQVEARTSGGLRIELQASHRRYQEREVLAAVGAGQIEIGATPLTQFAEHVPLCAAFLQPFMFNFDALIEAATKHESEIRTMIDAEILRRTNTRVLWWEPYGSSILVTRRVPVNDPMAIVVRPVGAADEQAKELLSMCGGLPRSVLPSDASAALENGTVEAIATDIMTVREHELWRVADTITNLRHAPSLFMVVINEQTWQKLTPDEQVILTELGQDAQNYMWARFVTIRTEAYALAVEKGMRIVELRPQDIFAWRACSAPLLETYMNRAGMAGTKLFAAYGRLRTLPCCRDAPAEMPIMPR